MVSVLRTVGEKTKTGRPGKRLLQWVGGGEELGAVAGGRRDPPARRERRSMQ